MPPSTPRQLHRETRDDPWSLEIASVLPKKVVDAGLTSDAIVKIRGHWHCALLADNSNSSDEKQYYLHVWYTVPNMDSLEDQKHKNPVLKLEHAKMKGCDDDLAVEVQVSPHDACFVYVVNKTSGAVLLWRLTQKDLTNMLPPPTSAVLYLDLEEEEETVSALHVQSPILLLGTTSGRIFWVHQSNNPPSLHAQPVDKGGFLSYLWGSSSRKTDAIASLVLVSSSGSSTTEPSTFLSFSESGKVTKWTATPSKTLKMTFESDEDLQLSSALNSYVEEPVRSVKVLEATCLDSSVHVLVLAEDTPALYWVVLEGDTIQYVKWLSRFVDPASVEIKGLQVVANGIGYAAFSQDETMATNYMALCNGTVHLMDVPTEHGSLLNVSLDTVTHGCLSLTTTGLGLRARCNVETTPSRRQTIPSDVSLLHSHLRSSFWEYYGHYSRSIQLPPSLSKASVVDLEAAIEAFGKELERRETGTAHNYLEWHSAFINLLQQTGLYRSLSSMCRWRLLAMGQQVAVYGVLKSEHKPNEWQKEMLSNLKPDKVADWLAYVGDEVWEVGGGQERQTCLVKWLCLAVQKAKDFRDERLENVYDLSMDHPPAVGSRSQVPVWTSSVALQSVLKKLIDQWQLNPKSAHEADVEIIVQAALASLADSSHSCPDEETENNVAAIQKEGIELLRKVKGTSEDQLAFDLCRQYHYYEGLCQIAHDHEYKRDRSEYDLEPLFSELAGLGNFALKWHCDHDLLGHVLKYGEHCPGALKVILETEEKMKPFRWVDAVRNKEYEKAAVSLMANVNSSRSNFAGIKRDISLASVANMVIDKGSQYGAAQREDAKRRKVDIDNIRELVIVQKELLGENADRERLWERDELLELAKQKCNSADDVLEKSRYCSLALAVCNTFGNPQEKRSKASEIWHLVVQIDYKDCLEKLFVDAIKERELVDRIRQGTLFSKLLSETDGDADWNMVRYDDAIIETLTLQHLSYLEPEHSRQLRVALHTVANSPTGDGDEDYQMVEAQSLGVDSFE